MKPAEFLPGAVAVHKRTGEVFAVVEHGDLWMCLVLVQGDSILSDYAFGKLYAAASTRVFVAESELLASGSHPAGNVAE